MSASSRPGVPVTLTARDLRVLADVASGPLSFDALAARRFPGCARKTTLNRLRRLVNAGYLRCDVVQLLERRHPSLFYRTTDAGRAALARLSFYADARADG